MVAAGFGGALKFDAALVFELFEPAFDGAAGFLAKRHQAGRVGAWVVGDEGSQGFWVIDSATYSATLFCSGFGEGQAKAAAEFFDGELHIGVVEQCLADADEAAAVFFDAGGEVKGLGHEFVAQA